MASRARSWWAISRSRRAASSSSAKTARTCRLLELQHPLLIGRVYPLNLVFEKAGKVNASLNVDFLRALSR